MTKPKKASNDATYRLFSLLAFMSLGGLLTFLLMYRTFLSDVTTGREIYLDIALRFAPLMISFAGAFAIFKMSSNALQRQLQEREDARQQYLAELEHTYQSAMYALVAALDSRDHLSGGHSRRVVAYALAIGERVGLSPAQKRDLTFGGYLHDVGKIGVEDSLLRKDSSLSETEWVEMRRHPIIGHEILQDVDFLSGASEVVLYHHERYDGRGYPIGLAGEDIPLLARLFAVADAFDAITADRPYRKALSFARAREIIAMETGKQFCPDCVRAFLSLTDEELRGIRREAEEGRRENLWQELQLERMKSPAV